MLYYTDLHIHSKYSRATSKSCNLAELALWGAKKGLSLISTGDFTHPKYFEEIKETLIEDENGTYRLKPEIEKEILKNNPINNDFLKLPRFILSVEISTIYKKGDKTRKVHHVVFSPNLESAQNFREKLDKIGNIKSDGRPILGLDSRNLLEIALESGEGSFIIPAHIWTPWFSVLGSKSGFDSIEECYEDLSSHIFALETGLSSDPFMNWHVSKLDRFRLVSNSDAHSPSKLAREATVFDHNPDYFSLLNSLKTGKGYIGTVEFFPEEGKYHEDGHRKCGVHLTPEETKKLGGICPVCKKPLTIGVSYRVNELSDRCEIITPPKTAGKTFSLIPLIEIISEIKQQGSTSKGVILEYEKLITNFGSELSILQNIPTDELSKSSTMLSEAIERLRQGKVIRQAGYDGEYGIIKLFNQEELTQKNFYNLKLDLKLESYPKQEKTTDSKDNNIDTKKPLKKFKDSHQKSTTLDIFQQNAVQDKSNQLLIVAGPGSGKTTVLTNRLAYLINNNKVNSENCLAITFTKKASEELALRLEKILQKDAKNINIHTFHSLCFSILKENYTKIGLNKDFCVMSDKEKELSKNTALIENAIGFDDLINLTLKLFKENKETLDFYKEKFKYISIDEYQDIDKNQYDLIRFLAPENAHIFAIGDPNQAIYGFRGGDSKFFNNFKQDYKNAKIINLKNNYRSTNTIVDASNQMINSFNIISKFDKPHEKITIHKAPTDRAEAEFVVSTIENLIGGHSFFSIDSKRSDGNENNYSFGDFAILYRTQTQLPAIKEALDRSAMPYSALSNKLLCERKEIIKLIEFLDDKNEISPQLEKIINYSKEDEKIKNFKEKIENNILKYLLNISYIHNQKSEFLREISLIKEIDTLDNRADRISVMTLHASKGLEFKCVFIVGLEDEILPLYRAKTNEEKEEERRLLYVGMTRAKEQLYLTHAQKRQWLNTTRTLEISPFLAKIKNDLLKASEFKKPQKETPKAQQLSLF